MSLVIKIQNTLLCMYIFCVFVWWYIALCNYDIPSRYLDLNHIINFHWKAHIFPKIPSNLCITHCQISLLCLFRICFEECKWHTWQVSMPGRISRKWYHLAFFPKPTHSSGKRREEVHMNSPHTLLYIRYIYMYACVVLQKHIYIYMNIYKSKSKYNHIKI